MSSLLKRRGQRAVMVACASALLVTAARAGVSLDSGSTVKILHYVEQDNAGAYSTKNVNPPPTSGSMPVPTSYQYSKTLHLDSGSSSASASIGAITNSSNVGFTFASGTGITQTDNASDFTNPAILKFNINGIWDVTSGGFGPTAYGYCAFTLSGNIPSGDTASVNVNLKWTNGGGTNLRSQLNQTVNFTHSSTFPYTFANSAVLNTGSVTSGQIKVTGTITFSASDPGATVGLQPLDFEMSAAPPTYTFQDSTGDVSDPNNWIYQMGALDAQGQPFEHVTPNSPGARAYFGPSNSSTPKNDLALSTPVTLGTLDIDRPNLHISGSNTTITFDTEANNAVLFLRNVHNFNPADSGTVIAAPIVLNKNLEINVDAPQMDTGINGPISGTGGIIKNGLGNLNLSAPNTFTGGIVLNSGTLTPTVNGALGNNNVTINGGMFNIMTPQPFGPGGGTIGVQSNSQVNVGMAGISGVNYNVAAFGAISGSAAQLGSLVIGNNFFPQPNSMISHQSFDTTIGSSNPQGITNAPTYLFGISNDFTSSNQNITVGSASATPWSGFGSDIAPHTFGGGANQFLGIAGTAQLVALGGQLKIVAPVLGGAGDKIIKNGNGLVSVGGANVFTGQTEVQSGPMAINSMWQGPITVDPGGSLGGTGNIDAPISFVDSASNPATFSPGMLGDVANGPDATSNQTVAGPGTLHTGGANFSQHTHLVYDLNTPDVAGGADNDLLVINGDLTLDGILDINGGLDFNVGMYTLMTYTGNLTATGTYPTGLLAFGNVDTESFPDAMVFNVPNPGGTGGSIVIAVPEPASVGLVALPVLFGLLRRRGRIDRSS